VVRRVLDLTALQELEQLVSDVVGIPLIASIAGSDVPVDGSREEEVQGLEDLVHCVVEHLESHGVQVHWD
jgi:hypothetical protein